MTPQLQTFMEWLGLISVRWPCLKGNVRVPSRWTWTQCGRCCCQRHWIRRTDHNRFHTNTLKPARIMQGHVRFPGICCHCEYVCVCYLCLCVTRRVSGRLLGKSSPIQSLWVCMHETNEKSSKFMCFYDKVSRPHVIWSAVVRFCAIQFANKQWQWDRRSDIPLSFEFIHIPGIIVVVYDNQWAFQGHLSDILVRTVCFFKCCDDVASHHWPTDNIFISHIIYLMLNGYDFFANKEHTLTDAKKCSGGQDVREMDGGMRRAEGYG